MRIRGIARALLLAISPIAASAQVFDVASVRPHSPEDARFGVKMPNAGRFSSTGTTAKLLLMLAYDVQESQIVGAPDWLEGEKWDVDAKSEYSSYTPAETRVMLQKLLADRFYLQAHRETMQRPVYALTVARQGPKFQSREDTGRGNILVTRNSIRLDSGSLAQFVQVLATSLGRPVIDETALSGAFDLSVQWDDAPVREGGLPGLDAPAPTGEDRGSIFSAMQNQLGLRLESKRAPVEILVVDHIDRPSQN